MMKSSNKTRWPLAPALLLLAANVIFLFWPWVAGGLSGESRFFEWDVPEQYWADLDLLCDSLSDGELPLWNPHDRAGYPAYADPQAGIYHPINWALCAIAGSNPNLFWAESRVLLGFLLAGVFGLMWLRRLGLAWGPALLGASVIQAAPFMRHNWELNLTLGLAYLPMMLWAAERVVTEQRLRDSALLALAIAACTWTGSPPALWQASMFTSFYLLWRISSQIRHREGPVVAVASLRATLFGALLAIPLCGVVVVPAFGLADLSVQAGRDVASLAEGSLSWKSLIALIWPQPGNHLYLGWTPLALMLLALLAAKFGRRKLFQFKDEDRLPGRGFFAVFLAFAILLALGTTTPLFGLLADHLPGFGHFRLPHRYEAWLGPAAGALAAAGLSWFSRERILIWAKQHRVVLIFAAALNLALAIVWILLFPGLGPAMLLASMGVVALSVAMPKIGSRHVMVGFLLAAAVVVDLSQALPGDRHTVKGVQPASSLQAQAVLEKIPKDDKPWRVMDEFGIGCRAGTRLGFRDLRGYQDPLQLKAYERMLSRLKKQPRLAEQFNMRYALTGPHFIHGWNRHFLPPPKELLAIEGARDLGQGVIEMPNPMPLAYFVPMKAAEVLPDRQSAMERLGQIAPSPVALLDRGDDGPDMAPELAAQLLRPSTKETASQDAVITAAQVDFSRNTLRCTIDAPTEGILIINEAWYPGWEATINGTPTHVMRANGLVRAVAVKAGMNVLEMKFAPFDATIWRWLLLLGWLLLAAIGIGALIKNRSQPPMQEKQKWVPMKGPEGGRTTKPRGLQTIPIDKITHGQKKPGS
ncbi:MAG: hypothetical protein JRF33_19260 [Deltaproteobacteria bacterium]|nr:hypothetical protein [Deltaproteobacteria bacterium]